MKGEGYLVTTKGCRRNEGKRRAHSIHQEGREQYGGNDERREFEQAMSNRRGKQEEGIKREGARLTGAAQQRCPS